MRHPELPANDLSSAPAQEMEEIRHPGLSTVSLARASRLDARPTHAGVTVVTDIGALPCDAVPASGVV
jgi:hypothetical protein